jgi:hypothetical protein
MDEPAVLRYVGQEDHFRLVRAPYIHCFMHSDVVKEMQSRNLKIEDLLLE